MGTASCELGTTSGQVWGGAGAALQHSQLPLKFRKSIIGKMVEKADETKRTLCAPLPWPCCFLFLLLFFLYIFGKSEAWGGRGSGVLAVIFALQTFLFNFSIFINLLA